MKGNRFSSFFGPHFPAFGLNTEIYRVNFCIQSKYRKIRARKSPNTDTFQVVWLHFISLVLSKKLTNNNNIKQSQPLYKQFASYNHGQNLRKDV